MVRSLHGVVYTRLWNADLLAVVGEFATDFRPPQTGVKGATGLYCGEQDLFAFLIDPTGWAEIGGEAFAPGFFVWNSEVGRRSLGIQTFWFQAVCRNHHRVGCGRGGGLHPQAHGQGRQRSHGNPSHHRDAGGKTRPAARRIRPGAHPGHERDARRDAESATKELLKHGIPRHLAQDAIEIARQQGRFTIFSWSMP